MSVESEGVLVEGRETVQGCKWLQGFDGVGRQG